jgi:transcriptional regulator with AAA-type ATPase domain/tetratricopeptide (TPR) repeat protein
LNCAAIPETLLEAELFGFERGAFTDARQPKAGLFQTAHGGTLFLDEVGLLPEGVQAKFLKVLEDGAVRRLGSTQSEPADVALVAATSEDLRDAVHGRRFREDLYHRLAVVTVRLPSLAERASDILLLAEHFLGRACADYGLGPKILTPDARTALLAYAWPGNVRELANLMERVALLTETPAVTAAALGLPMMSVPELSAIADREPMPFRDAMGTVEREHLLAALRETDWNVARAAARLRIPRGTLRYRIEKLALQRSESSSARLHPPAPGSVSAPAPPPRAAPARGAPTWERRQLAFLRLGLVPPKDGEIGLETTRVLELLAEKMESFGGRIEALGPLGMVAAFGLEPVEDAPRRAAHAAIAMRKAAARARPSTTEPIGLALAIHAVAGLVGPTAETPVIDVAATGRAHAVLEALMTVVERDVILVSPAAARALERRFTLVSVGPVEPLGGPAYRLEGLEQPGLAPRASMTPFVGRELELEQLRHAMERAAAGHGKVVAIIGEPGVGKSRLIWELVRAHQGHGWRVLRAGAVSYGQARPYGPVIDLLKTDCRIDDRDAPQEIREKVRGRLHALDLSLGSNLDALLALLDIPVEDGVAWQALDPAQRRQRTLDALKRLWLREAQINPLLFVVEDLHWVDAETQAWLDSLVESLPTTRLCLVVDYRPEYQHGWGSKPAYTQLRLDPLSRESAQMFLRTLLGDTPELERLTALLIERTEGNPFFLEETVQTLVETKALKGERGAHSLARPIDTIEVPTTVEAVLAARIDRLPLETRRLLQAASVIGKDVPVVLLQAIAGISEGVLRSGLATLQAAELLYEARVVPDLEYTFKHALTHEVAYGGVPPDQRRGLHRRIVEAIEALSGERLGEHAERLAHHALRGELWDKAATHFRQAGLRAAAQAAYREAVGHLEQALGALRRLPGTRQRTELIIDINLDLRSALEPLDWVRQGEPLHEAEALARALGDQFRLARIASLMVDQRLGIGDWEKGVRFGQEALSLARTLGDRSTELVATTYLGLIHAHRGEFTDAATLLERNVVALGDDLRYERFGTAMIQSAFSQGNLADVLSQLGQFDEAIEHAKAGVRVAEEADHHLSLVPTLLSLGLAHLRRGDLPRATQPLERCLDLTRTRQFVNRTPYAAAALGAAYVLAGRVEEGLPLLADAVEAFSRRPDPVRPALILLCAGMACLSAGRIDEARSHTREALALSRRLGARGAEAHALYLAGDVALTAGEEDAEAHYREALALATQLGMRPTVAHCHFGLGQLHRRAGEREPAREHLTTATLLYREMGMTFWLEKAEAVLGAPREISP